MKDANASQRPNRAAAGTKSIVEPRTLLAAVSLLGVSLGVSMAAPVEQMSATERAPRSGDASLKVAETRTHGPGNSAQSLGSMGWDVRPVQSNRPSFQSGQHKFQSDQNKLQSDQKKAYLPAVQNGPKY
jgi:hypothetical protein